LVCAVGRNEDGLPILSQDPEPAFDISCVVGSQVIRDLKIGAEERCAELGDQLFHGIGIIAKALAELPVEAVLGAGPMRVMPISA
jgi:hypothetical protein